MQFTLPAELAQSLQQYDPGERARLAEEQHQAKLATTRERKPRGKSRPLGTPPLLPTNIVSRERLIRALDTINASTMQARHEHWNDADGRFLAQIYHLSLGDAGKTWIAAWINPKRDRITIRWMARPSNGWKLRSTWFRKRSPHNGDENFVEPKPVFSDIHRITTGGEEWLMRDWSFSKRSIMTDPNVIDVLPLIWPQRPNGRLACNKGDFPAHTFERVLRAFKAIAPTWADAANSRYSPANPLARLQSTPATLLDQRRPDWQTWQPSINDIELPQLKTPYFRKQFHALYSEWNDCFQNDPDAGARDLKSRWENIYLLIDDMTKVVEIWPDITPDHLQQLWTIRSSFVTTANWPLRGYSPSNDHHYSRSDTAAARWLTHRMPIERWIHWSQSSNPQQLSQFLRLLGSFLIAGHSAGYSDPPAASNIYPTPKRWRLEEVLVDLEERNFMLSHPDDRLPQDLFPAPIKLDTGITLFQPLSSHQLVSWGSAVRNCVGNGSYAQRVLDHQAFIVLGLVRGTPTFTAQLSLRGSVLHLDQITKVSNARPSDIEMHQYQEAMSQALAMAAAQTKP